MEKYGVATPKKPEGEKTAGKEQGCPSCGGEVDKTSPQPHCPTDGTKPFETPKGK
jgi:hypothetical protein